MFAKKSGELQKASAFAKRQCLCETPVPLEFVGFLAIYYVLWT